VLAKASDLDIRALENHAPEICADFRSLAVRWRGLAHRELVQDQNQMIDTQPG